MKNIFFAYAWILLTVGIMLTSIAGYYFFLMPKKEIAEVPAEEVVLGTHTLDTDLKGVTSIVETADARATLVAMEPQRRRPRDTTQRFTILPCLHQSIDT